MLEEPGPAVRAYHVYKDVWEPTIGEKLNAGYEPDNAGGKFAMKVVNTMSAIYVASTREFCDTLSHAAEGYAWK